MRECAAEPPDFRTARPDVPGYRPQPGSLLSEEAHKNPEYFDLYSPLKLLYIRDNDTIRKKTKEELMDTIKSIQDINTIRYLMDVLIKEEKENITRSC